jgi:hypothetical protein
MFMSDRYFSAYAHWLEAVGRRTGKSSDFKDSALRQLGIGSRNRTVQGAGRQIASVIR